MTPVEIDSAPAPAERERARLRVVLWTMFNAVAGVILFSRLPGSDGRSAAAIGYIGLRLGERFGARGFLLGGLFGSYALAWVLVGG